MLRTKSLLVLILISCSLHSAEAPRAHPVATRDIFLEKILIKELCPIDVTQEVTIAEPLNKPQFAIDLQKARVSSQIDIITYDEKNQCHYVAGCSTPCWGDGMARLHQITQGETRELFKDGEDAGRICTMHLCADNSLITTHTGGKVYRWNVTKNPAEKTEIVDFDLPGQLSGATPIVSDLTDDEQKLYLGINKKYGNNYPETLSGQIVCHNFANPTQRKFIFDPSDCAMITRLKALPGNQIVCARLNRPHIIPMCDPYKRHLTEPFKSTIQLLDAESGTKLVQFNLEGPDSTLEALREGPCSTLKASDDGQLLSIQVHNRLFKMASLRRLETVDRKKLRAMTMAIDHKKFEKTTYDENLKIIKQEQLSNAERYEFLTKTLDNSEGIELVHSYSETKQPEFFTWQQIIERRHAWPQDLIEKVQAGGTDLSS